MTITLYHHRGACSLAPLVALEESGLDYHLEVVNLADDRTAYRAVNPSGKVPALVVDGELLTENVAILYRIASLAPDARMLPDDPADIAKILSTMAWFASTLHILRRQIRMPLRFTPDADAQAKLVEAGRPRMKEALDDMASRLQPGSWFSGARFGVADAYALVFYGWGLVDGYDLDAHPTLADWRHRMLVRPAVRAALANDAGPLHAAAAEAVT